MGKSQSKRGKTSGVGPRVGHLDTLAGILREMICVYREVRLGKTAAELGCKLIFMLRETRATCEAVALQERIRAWEEKLDKLDAVGSQVLARRLLRYDGKLNSDDSQAGRPN